MNNFLVRSCLFFIFISVNNVLFGQECLDYGVFDDPECNFCAPAGWDYTSAAEMDSPQILPCGLGASPSGGTVVGLNNSPNPGNSGNETIYTTINGLVPGQSYIIVFWYATPGCTTGTELALEVTVDGVLYDFPIATDWSLAEICVVAEDSSMDILLSGTSPTNPNGTTYIDDADCDDAEVNCCPLMLELPEEEEVCPNQSVVLEGEVSGEFGTLMVEWFCDPPEGLNYLSNTSIVNPVFLFPNSDPNFEGTEFVYELIVSDDNCEVSEIIEVTVFPVTIPEFTFEDRYCETEGFIDLPTVSDNGFSGIWQMPINTFDWPGQIVTNIFIPDQWQVGCPIETPFEFNIEEFFTPEFDFPRVWCRSKTESFEFPQTSTNGVDGEWNIPVFYPEDYSDGIIEFTFTPYDIFCSEIVTIQLELTSGDLLQFNLPDLYCNDQDFITLPEESFNGINGTWSEPIIDLRQISGTYTVSFTPEDEDCYAVYEYSFEVTGAIPLTLDTLSPICRNYGTVTLDSLTPEGYLGYWSTPMFDPDTVSANQFISTWTPLPDQSPCISDSTVTFIIEDPILSDFDLPDNICISDTIFDLPTISLNDNITGSWSIPSVDPQGAGTGIIQTIFTPADTFCALPFIGEIEITDFIVPVFSFPLTVCELDDPFTLSNISDNDITGSWSNNNIDPEGLAGQIITSVFTPIEGQECAEALSVEIEIQSPESPEFNLPEYLCWTEVELMLNNVSDNGISGSWNINPLVINDYLGTNVQLEFTPVADLCANVYSSEVIVVDYFNIDISSTNPTGCSESDGKILILGETSQLEFSLDDGDTWQNDPCFENMSAGSYTVQVRSANFSDCQLTINTELIAPGAPEILSVDASSASTCDNNDGSISIDASGSNLEYSIDGGVTWSINNIFTDLSPGVYTIVVREEGVNDCASENSAEISSFPITVVEFIDAIDPTDCESNDGIIEITATGQNLEYSIDNGISWNDSNLFENLIEGTYIILVRSKDEIDCIEQSNIDLIGPASPTINTIDVTQPGNCAPSSGEIIIDASGNELEYSIDNGVTWQADPRFTDLPEGSYIVLIRERLFQNCTDKTEVTLIEELQELEDIDYYITPMSACDVNDAQITILSANPDVEISLDQGSTWQTDLTIDNLAPGDYEIWVRHILNNNCRSTLNITIDQVACPCVDLEVSFIITPMYCIDVANGSIEITDTEGNQDDLIDIVWDNGETGAILNNLSGGWYAFTVYYDNDCEWRDSAFVDQIDPLDFMLMTYDPNCPGAADGTIEVTEISGGNGNFTYSINGVDYQVSNVFVNLSEAEYQVFVLDDQNCLQSQFVNLQSDDPLEIDLPQIMTIQQGETVTLNPLINETSIDSFSWDSHPTILNPGELIAIVAPQETTNYTLYIYYGQCLEIRTITVEVESSDDIYIPNIFTPSEPDINGTFFLQSKSDANIQVLSMYIYDRWGNLMFHNDEVRLNEPNDGWDGYYNEYKVQPGVYVYLVEYMINGKIQHKAGTVTVY